MELNSLEQKCRIEPVQMVTQWKSVAITNTERKKHDKTAKLFH